VLDPPTLPTRHARPKRSLIVVFFTFIGGVLALSYEWTRSVGGVSRALSILTGPERNGSPG